MYYIIEFTHTITETF